MSSIKEIVSHLESELNGLIKPYLNQIEQLKNENENLISDIKILKYNNKKLQKQLSHITIKETESNNEFLLSHLEDISPFIPLELIDELFLPSTIENSYLLLFHCDNFLKKGQLDKAYYIIELLFHNPKPLLHSDTRIHGLIQSVFNQLMVIGRKDLEDLEAFEGVIEAFIKLLYILQETVHKDEYKLFLKNHYSELLDATLHTNEASLIIDMFKLLMTYDLQIELDESLSHVIDKEWKFLDYNLTKNEFCFFLWYSYLFDLDQTL